MTETQNYEVIGSPPNIAVPTHFAKVVLASRPSSPSTPDILDVSTGAFVLPNAIIPDDASLESFVTPGTLPTLLSSIPRSSPVTPFFFQTRTRTRTLTHATSPVDTVERAAGLTLFSDALKHASKHICKTTKCEVIVRRFDEVQKRPEMRRAVSAPR